MIYSDTVRYALLALTYLATCEGRLVKAEEIASAKGIPKPFLSKILHELARRGILTSVKGPKGGFALKVDPSKLSLWDVVSLLGEDTKFGYCLLYPETCDALSPENCVVHEKWAQIKEQALEFLKSTTLLDLVRAEGKLKDAEAPANP